MLGYGKECSIWTNMEEEKRKEKFGYGWKHTWTVQYLWCCSCRWWGKNIKEGGTDRVCDSNLPFFFFIVHLMDLFFPVMLNIFSSIGCAAEIIFCREICHWRTVKFCAIRSSLFLLFLTAIVWFQETLRALWDASYPGEELHGLVSEQWKEMGWQGKDPSTDFRYILLHLVYL